MKTVYFSPLPPQASGISEYSADLLPYLAQHMEVRAVVVEDYVEVEQSSVAPVPVLTASAYESMPERDDCLNIYHMGNSPYHQYVYPILKKRPGITVLHDHVLHHFVLGNTVDRDDPGEYLREMEYSLGRRGLEIASDVIAGAMEPPCFEYPLATRAIDSSLGVIVHSSYVRDLVLEERPDIHIKVAPMGIPVLEQIHREEARARLGLSPHSCIVASFGEASPHKRIDVVARAFARFHGSYPDSRYLIVGNTVPSLDVISMVRKLGLQNTVTITGFVPKERFQLYMAAADVCVNLRYPTAGETSASALRAMAAGRATIISNVGAAREVPGDACLKVDVDSGEEETLLKYLHLLAENQEFKDNLERKARQYVARKHSLEGAARLYFSFIREIQNAVPPALTHLVKKQRNVSDGWMLDRVAQEMDDIGVAETDTGLIKMVAKAMSELGVGAEYMPPDSGRGKAPGRA